MKAASFLLLVLGAASASACDSYHICHCQDSNGSANDQATNTACSTGFGYIQRDPTNTFAECVSDEQGAMDNVAFKQYCWKAGQTGDDSNCREKL